MHHIQYLFGICMPDKYVATKLCVLTVMLLNMTAFLPKAYGEEGGIGWPKLYEVTAGGHHPFDAPEPPIPQRVGGGYSIGVPYWNYNASRILTVTVEGLFVAYINQTIYVVNSTHLSLNGTIFEGTIDAIGSTPWGNLTAVIVHGTAWMYWVFRYDYKPLSLSINGEPAPLPVLQEITYIIEYPDGTNVPVQAWALNLTLTFSIVELAFNLSEAPKPFWLTWWFWTIIAGTVATGVTVAVMLKKKLRTNRLKPSYT